MSRSNKSRIAVTLLSALAFGANAQAQAQAQDLNKNKITKTDGFSIKSTKPAQNSGKSGRVTIEETKSIDWKTVVGGTIGVLVAGETVHSIVGAATDSKLGSYSVGRAIKNYVNKNKQRDPGKKFHFGDEMKKKIDKAVLEYDKDKDKDKNKNLGNIEKNKNVVVNEVPNVVPKVSLVSDNFQQNKQQSITCMNKMVNQMPQNLKVLGNSVVVYLSNVVINNPNGLNLKALYYISTGQGVITDCNYFQDHNIWCFGIEVTYREDNSDKKVYTCLAPGLQMPNGKYGVKSRANDNFQNGLVNQWPDDQNRGPIDGGGNFI
ncbi:MAG: hypothetical protein J6P21_02670 [Clostridia bacterium]|nr:hypothetical protein [Clostridia bacterium]